jgi:hypothetical protein
MVPIVFEKTTFCGFLTIMLASCSNPLTPTQVPITENAATLYRNSPLEQQTRLLVATFNGNMMDNGNMENCGMTARVLNANMDALRKAGGTQRDPQLGFWCEPRVNSEGPVPSSFESEFPSNVRTLNSW